MFLKRLMKSESTPNNAKLESSKPSSHCPPPGMQTMGASLQSKFAKGVNYNMKIIIKGDRNVGKTCLHLRLQGKKFREEYLPTDEIQVASIQWSYKTSDDIIKVEIWDVVDKGRRKKMDGLKLNMTLPHLPEETCLDAEFVDVFKGTHGVIMVFDITKQWTFDYVEKELPKVPSTTPILILANHRDMGHHRTVSDEQVQTLVEEARQSREGPIKCAEASMRNGYGLKYIHKFFSLPFLHLQKMTLMVQLEKNFEDLDATMQELDLLEGTEDQNYEFFSDSINLKRREHQDKLAEKAIDNARIQQQQQQQMPANQTSKTNGRGGVNNEASMTKSLSFSTSLPPIREAPAANLPSTLNLQPQNPSKKLTLPTSSTTIQVSLPSKSEPSTPCQSSTEVESASSGSFLGKLLNSTRKSKKESNANVAGTCSVTKDTDIPTPPSSSSLPPVKNVDEFKPEADDFLEDGFLDDLPDESKQYATSDFRLLNAGGRMARGVAHQDSDDETFSNPLVAGFQDVLDTSDEESLKPVAGKADSPTRIDLSSDDDNDYVGCDDDLATNRKLINGFQTKSKHQGRKEKTRTKPEFGDSDCEAVEINGEISHSTQTPPPVFHTFNAADFDALEEKYIKNAAEDSSIIGADGPSTSTDDDVTKKKKKKLKNKELSDDGKKKSDKSKKSKQKDKAEDTEKRKKKNRKDKDDEDLEKFLESSTTYESL